MAAVSPGLMAALAGPATRSAATTTRNCWRPTRRPPVSHDQRESLRICTCTASGSSTACSCWYSCSHWRTSSSDAARHRPRPSMSSSYLATGGHVIRARAFFERRLRRREPCERDAVGRAAHIVEAEAVAERDRLRLAAVLAADADLDVGLRGAPALDADPHQVADAAFVDRLERIRLEDAVLHVEGQELPFCIVARHAERRLREVVRPEREEVRDLGDLVCAQGRPGQLDHRPAQVVDLGRLLGHYLLGQLAQPAKLLLEADERVHDLDHRR